MSKKEKLVCKVCGTEYDKPTKKCFNCGSVVKGKKETKKTTKDTKVSKTEAEKGKQSVVKQEKVKK